MPKYVIYALLDARYPDRIYYVGKTGNFKSRLRHHLFASDKATQAWVTQVKLSGSVVAHKTLARCIQSRAAECELFWIRFYTSPYLLNLNGRLPQWFDFGAGEPRPIYTLAEIESRYIAHVLTLTGGNKLETARLLGIGRQTIYNKLGETPALRKRAANLTTARTSHCQGPGRSGASDTSHCPPA